MNCRMVAPPDVEKEAEQLYELWSALPEESSGEWFDYLKKNGSEAVQSYMRECEKIQAQLDPGEYM